MMPTVRKNVSSSVIGGDGNTQLNLKSNQLNLSNNSSQVLNNSSSLIDFNDEIKNNFNQNSNEDLINNQKNSIDLTINNNIVDCLTNTSIVKDSSQPVCAKENSNKNELNLVSSHFDNQLNGSHLSTTNSIVNDHLATNENNHNQKSKHKKFANNKNRDSSSSNGSLVSNSNLPTITTANNHQINKEYEQQYLRPNWKFSKTHQKRFKRRFPTIESDEQLIDWYSCALIADILLQGYLYISENYFAFYSNIFGYKTHVVVKVKDVYAVTKEKTAKIFPNAVGIHTKQNKFVFGSLLSRENTFKLLNEVRSSYLNLNKADSSKTDLSEDDLLDSSCNKSGTLTLTEPTATLKRVVQNSDELNSSNELIDNKIIHSEDFKLDTLKRHHRRSSSLKSSSIKETQENGSNNGNKKSNQAKLLKPNKFTDLNSILLKLSSIRSILRIDLKGTKSSFLILSIGFLLFLLLLSISILLIRINNAHDKLISMSKYSKKISVPEVKIMYQMIEVMKMNLKEIGQLKSKSN